MDLSELLQGLWPVILALIAILGTGRKKPRPEGPNESREVEAGEGSLAPPTRLDPPVAAPPSGGSSRFDLPSAAPAPPPPPPPATPATPARPAARRSVDAGERVSPDPFTRPEPTKRPSWVDALEDEVARGEDVLGTRKRTLTRMQQVLEVEEREERPRPTRRSADRTGGRPMPTRGPPEHRRGQGGGRGGAIPDMDLRMPDISLGDTPQRRRKKRTTRRSKKDIALRDLIGSRSGLRAALVARELLDPPPALRDDGSSPLP